MKTIEIRNRSTNEVIFSKRYKNNTVKTTVTSAVAEGISLANADLSGADLSHIKLKGAHLKGAKLEGASLYGASLYRANLSGAHLIGVNLSGANLKDANLSHACLRNSNLIGANLYDADLSVAYLRGANLDCASMTGTNLTGAEISCFGNMKEIFTMQLECWEVGFTKEFMGEFALRLSKQRLANVDGRSDNSQNPSHLPVSAIFSNDGKIQGFFPQYF